MTHSACLAHAVEAGRGKAPKVIPVARARRTGAFDQGTWTAIWSANVLSLGMAAVSTAVAV
jgi:hypothetical protein